MTDAQKKLKPHRQKIDQADRAILRALGSRFQAVLKIGKIKKQLGLPARQKARWQELMRERLRLAKTLGLNPKFVEALYRLIHRESLSMQSRKKKRKS